MVHPDEKEGNAIDGQKTDTVWDLKKAVAGQPLCNDR
jgi:hypothetical protein